MVVKTEFLVTEAKIRDKNQITIPSELIDVLNVHPGDFLRFEVRPRAIIVSKSVTHNVPRNHVRCIEGATD
jgi:bifunctional DNA-binding transcriptional regulator/antitoxin component of YhaV-PrlF toxin-antitoxin module